jgi:hypothetical protein
MALTYTGAATALQRGVELAEPGIGVTSFEIRYFPRVSDFHENNFGERDGRVVSSLPSREIHIDGEVTGTTGRMADTFLTAITTIANDTTTFGGSGQILLQEVTETQSRANWRMVKLRYESDPGLP